MSEGHDVTELEQRVLDGIRERRLAPRPRVFFLAKRSVFWTLAGLSVALGAVSVAALIYLVTDHYATGGQGFEEMPLDDFFEHVPFVWVATLILFVTSAAYSVRRTRRGYRYPTALVIAAALFASVVLGGLLHLTHAGWRTHEFLEAAWPAYERFTESADDEWDQPDAGRLAGSVIGYDGAGIVTLRDFDGVIWTVSVAGAKLDLDEPLGSDEDVAIIGKRTGPASFTAHSIGEWD